MGTIIIGGFVLYKGTLKFSQPSNSVHEVNLNPKHYKKFLVLCHKIIVLVL